MTTEALAPAAAEPSIATGGGGGIVLLAGDRQGGVPGHGAVSGVLSPEGSRTQGRGRRTDGRSGNSSGGARREGSGCATSHRSTWPPTSLTHPGSAPTVKQHLAAIRMLGDWLVVSQVLPVNPAAAVAGPEARRHEGRDAGPLARRRRGSSSPRSTREPWPRLRDRALLSVMLYSFARVSAVLGMRRQDYFGQANRAWLRLHEKGGKRHDVPAHHRAAAALDAYVEAAGLEEPKVALFQSVDPAGRRLTGRALERRVVLAMIKRRAAAAELPPSTCCHTFRATGITAYLSNGGDARARAANRGARVAEDDEALRPDGGHGDGGRDRADRDLSVDIPPA